MAYVSSAGLPASIGAARTGMLSRLLVRIAARWAAYRAAAAERRAFDEMMAISCPSDRARLLAEYEIAATRHNP